MISEKVSCRLISRGKKHANKFLGEKYPALKKLSLMTYNAEKKLYREKNSNFREVWEKVLPIQTKSVKSPIPHYPTPPQTSNGHFNHLGGDERNGFNTFVNVIYQQNGWGSFMMWWFSRLEFCFLRLKIPQ